MPKKFSKRIGVQLKKLKTLSKKFNHLPLGFLLVFGLSLISYVGALFYPNLIKILEITSNDSLPLFFVHLFTHMFDHANFMHFAGNFMFGGPLCLYLERRVGFKKFLGIFVFTGILGSLFFMLAPSLTGWTGLLGSSVAISGCVAYALLKVDENLPVKILALCFLAFLITEQFMMSCVSVVVPAQVAYAGHLGGMLVALLLFNLLEKKK